MLKIVKKSSMSYQHLNLSEKWSKIWDELGIYRTPEQVDREKEYILVEFPYPSGSGLHLGHAFTFTGADIYARFQRMQGKDVLFPMGWDAFGLPTENYAIKTKSKPQQITKENTIQFKEQMKKLQFSFDWEKEINTTDPDYYKWTQWIFVQLFKRGLTYKKEMPINWCPQCKTGLANEEVVDNKCERCGAEVSRRNISQWIVKITDYADRLIDGLDKTDFIKKVKTAQINWIGKSQGAQVIFKIKVDKKEEDLEVFTTRPDTLWGATFMVLAPEHPFVASLLKIKNAYSAEVASATKAGQKSKIKNIKEIKKYLEVTKKKSDLDRTDLAKEKTGVFSGLYAINPVNNKKIPVWISDFVLISYGTGAIMSVPAHDERDWEFAKKFNLDIIPVIQPKEGWDFEKSAYTDVSNGKIINSKPINGLNPDDAFEKMINWLEKKKIGRRAKNYHLRDWVFSRQHYWGEPIPMIFCERCSQKIKSQILNSKSETNCLLRRSSLGYEGRVKSQILNSKFQELDKYAKKNNIDIEVLIENPGWFPVPEEQLPIELPEVKHYEPTNTGESPLAKIDDWVNTICPKCGGPAKRETDTMPNWAGSDWYFLRYIDTKNDKVLADKEKIKKWLPVDIYIGGDEHNTLHLLYSRFIYQFLWDINAVPKEYLEPYQKRVSHGVILGPDNQRMSKSKGNVVEPEEVMGRFDKYGSDILRMYLMFIGPFEGTMAWNDQALMGMKRFLEKVEDYIDTWVSLQEKHNGKISSLAHQTIKKVTEDIKNLRFNTAIACLMEFLNSVKAKKDKVNKEDLKNFLILLSPFVPIFSEEQWQKINPESKSIFLESWPVFDFQLAKHKKIEFVVQVNGKIRGKIEAEVGISQKQAEKIIFSMPQVQKYLQDKEIKKVIFVPNKLINFVV